MSHKLIELTKHTSMPAPFDSVDAGEAWVWGDYVALMQTKPKTVAEMMMEMANVPKTELPPFDYPFVMTVFYRKDKNPHGPSSRPIMVATLETADYAKAYAQMKKRGMEIKESDMPKKKSVVQGLFTGEGRYNLGNFDEILTRDTARQYFLNWMRKTLSLAGEPEIIGSLKEVYGNPKTGWEPAELNRPKNSPNKGKGCAAVIAGWILLAVVALVVILQLAK